MELRTSRANTNSSYHQQLIGLSFEINLAHTKLLFSNISWLWQKICFTLKNLNDKGKIGLNRATKAPKNKRYLGYEIIYGSY